MSPIEPSGPQLSAGRDCDCCTGADVRTPRNVPVLRGEDAFDYRIGTYADFFATLRARLSSLSLNDDLTSSGGAHRPPLKPLSALTTRDSADPSIALLDAFAVIADVLTFYQERIANEGFLRTARDYRSIIELGRLVGYQPRPGVSASVYLAYTLDPKSNTTIPAGHATRSVPEPDRQDQTAQTFETSDRLAARGSLSKMRPLMSRPQFIDPADRSPDRVLYLTGTSTNLKRNDPLLFVFDDPSQNHLWRVAAEPETDSAANLTLVRLQPWETSRPAPPSGKTAPALQQARQAIDDYKKQPQLAFVRDPSLEFRFESILAPLRRASGEGKVSMDQAKPLVDAINQLKNFHTDFIGRGESSSLDQLIDDLNDSIPTSGDQFDLKKLKDGIKAYDSFKLAGFGGERDPDFYPLLISLGREYYQIDSEVDHRSYAELAQTTDVKVSKLLPFLPAGQDDVTSPEDVLKAVENAKTDIEDVFGEISDSWRELGKEVNRIDTALKRVTTVPKPNDPASLVQFSQELRLLRRELLDRGPLTGLPLALTLANNLDQQLQQVQEDILDSQQKIDESVYGEILNRAVIRVRELRRAADESGSSGLLKRLQSIIEYTQTVLLENPAKIKDIAGNVPGARQAAREQLQKLLAGSPVPNRFSGPLEGLQASLRNSLLTPAEAFTFIQRGLIQLFAGLIVETSEKPRQSRLVNLLNALTRASNEMFAGELCDIPQRYFARTVEEQTQIVARTRRSWEITLCRLGKISSLGDDFDRLPVSDRRRLRAALVPVLVPADTGSGAPLLPLLSSTALALSLSGLLVRLRRESVVLQGGGWPRLRPWFEAMQTETEQIAQRLPVGIRQAKEIETKLRGLRKQLPDPSADKASMNSPHECASAPNAPSGGASAAASSDKQPLPLRDFCQKFLDNFSSEQDLLGGLFANEVGAGLLKAPSRPPASSAALGGCLQNLFGSDTAEQDGAANNVQSDALTRLLLALQPRLQGKLYPALANTQVVRTNPFQRVEALRITAAPFGATAPMKPKYNGTFTGKFEEWHLAGCLTFTATLTLLPKTFTADVKVKAPGQPDQSVTQEKPIEIKPGQGDTSQENTVIVSVTLEPNPSGEGKLTLKVAPALDAAASTSRTIAIRRQPQDHGDLILLARVENVETSLAQGETNKPVELIDDTVYLSRSKPTDKDDIIIVTGALISPLAQSSCRRLDLDAVYERITPGSHIAILRGGAEPGSKRSQPQITQVNAVETAALAAFGITGKSTRLLLHDNWLSDADKTLASLRGVTILAQSDPLELAEEPYDADVYGEEIQLDGVFDGLEAGRYLIVEGERTDLPGVRGVRERELVMIAGSRQGLETEPADAPARDSNSFCEQLSVPSHDCAKPLPQSAKKPAPATTDCTAEKPPPARVGRGPGRPHTTVVLKNGLAFTYKRDTVTIYGNVVKATHGETRREVLGSGDPAQPRQAFPLKQKPLTYLPAPLAGGIQAELKVRVNDVAWQRVERLAGLHPDDHAYTLRTEAGGTTTVQFGDGRHGARLPSGRENVRAVYRIGLGKAGNVKAGQITQLLTRPPGLVEVINPMPASGGADPETADQARGNVPSGLLALERLVSLRDYEDFARSFAGIAKARAGRLFVGRDPLVHLTVAGSDDIPIDSGDELLLNLRAALRRLGDPTVPVMVAPRALRIVLLELRVKIDPDRLWDHVSKDIRTGLQTELGFDRRDLGQSLDPSDVLAVVQHVPGVAYVSFNRFGSVSDNSENGQLPTPQTIREAIQKIPVLGANGLPTPIPARKAPQINLRQDRSIEILPVELVYISNVPETLILNQILDEEGSR